MNKHTSQKYTLELINIQAMLDKLPDAVILMNLDQSICTCNSGVTELFGYRNDAFDSIPLTELLLFEPVQQLTDALDDLRRSRQSQHLDLTARRSDFSTFDADVILAPFSTEDDFHGFICSIRDISHLKESEHYKDEFIANLTHEVRAPLASLKVNHRLLHLGPDQRETYIDRIGIQIDRLDTLITNLLRLAQWKHTQEQIQLTPIDLNNIIVDTTNECIPTAEDKGLTMHCSVDEGLSKPLADRGLISQVLYILLTNAVCYTPPGGEIIVKMHQKDTWVGFSVRDSGYGISPEEIPHVFKRFYRGKIGRTSNESGSGLGLALAKEIVEHFNGKLDIHSEGIPGQGAKVNVWLPIS